MVWPFKSAKGEAPPRRLEPLVEPQAKRPVAVQTLQVPFDLPAPIGQVHQGSNPQMRTQSGWLLPNGITYSTHDGRVSVAELQNVGRRQLVRSSAVFRATELIATNVAGLIQETLHVIDDEGKVIKPNGNQRKLMNLLKYSPNDEEGAFEFICNVCVDYLLSGNGLIGMNMIGADPVSLHRILPDVATTAVDGSVRRYDGPVSDDFFTGTNRRDWRTFAANRVVHIRFRNLSGVRRTDSRAGFSTGILEILADTLNINVALDKYVLSFFGSPISNFRIQIGAERPVGKDDAVTFQSYMNKIAEDGENFVFLPDGLTLNPVTAAAIDQQTAELRKMQIREVARAFGLPTYVLNEERTGINQEIAAREIWQSGIRPHVRAMLGAMTHRMLNRFGATKGYRFAIDETELVKGSWTSLVALLNATSGDAQRPSLATSGERREWIGLPAEMPEDENEERLRKDLAANQGNESEESGGGLNSNDDPGEGGNGGNDD